jgi:hypothetical protein
MFTRTYLVYSGDNETPKEIIMAGVGSGHPQRYMTWKNGDQVEVTQCDCGPPAPGQISKQAANWAVRVMPSIFQFVEVELTPKDYATGVITELITTVMPHGIDVHSLMSRIPKSPVKLAPKIVVTPTKKAEPIAPTPVSKPEVKAEIKPEPPVELEVEPIEAVPEPVIQAEGKQAVQKPAPTKLKPKAVAGNQTQNDAVANALKANKKKIVIG